MVGEFSQCPLEQAGWGNSHCPSGLSLPTRPSARVVALLSKLGGKRLPAPAQPSPVMETNTSGSLARSQHPPGKWAAAHASSSLLAVGSLLVPLKGWRVPCSSHTWIALLPHSAVAGSHRPFLSLLLASSCFSLTQTLTSLLFLTTIPLKSFSESSEVLHIPLLLRSKT